MSPAPDAAQVALHETLLDALDHDPFIRFELDAGSLDQITVRSGAAVAWTGRHRSGVRWCTGLAAEPSRRDHLAAAAELVTELVASTAPVSGVTVSRGGRDLLPPPLRPDPAWEWDFWWTDSAPDPSSYAVPGFEVVDLAPDDARVAPLLALASPTAPIAPGDPRVVRWAGIVDVGADVDGTGGLVAMLAVTRHRSGVDHLNDVATHPARRGRRLARLLCGQVTSESLAAGRPAVTLGMYADNDAARRVYSASGFELVRGQTSGSLATTPAPHG